jgi:beta-lactamase regulating signal transducer with metallopeptidase domain
MAHIQRRDFAWNLLCEVMSLPVSYHPAVWMLKREIRQFREMACDDLVTGRLINRQDYACSIVRIAESVATSPKAGWALGVFDSGNLERRISRLTSKQSWLDPRAAGWRFAAAVLLVAVTAVSAGISLLSPTHSYRMPVRINFRPPPPPPPPPPPNRWRASAGKTESTKGGPGWTPSARDTRQT